MDCKSIGWKTRMKFLFQYNIIRIKVTWLSMMFEIFFNHFISNVACTPHPISYRPKMSTPIPLHKLWVFFLHLLDVLPFNRLTKSLIASDGRYSTCIWTWSLLTTPFKILTSSASHICLTKSLHLFWISPSRTLYRYFVTHTICTVSQDTVWLPVLISFPIRQRYQIG